jgi:DNA-directed RNA polymerase
MRQSLESLYDQVNKSETFEKVSEALNSSESPELFKNNYEMALQRSLEEGAYASAIEVWKHEMNEAMKRGNVYTGRLGMRSLAWEWVQAMKTVLEGHIETLRPKDVDHEGRELRLNIDKLGDNARIDHVWLTALPLETMCAITIMEIIRYQVNELRSIGCKATNLITKVGRAVEKEIQASDLVRRENKGLHPRHINLRQLLAKKNHAERYAAKFHQELVNGSVGGVSSWPYEWNQEVRARVLPLAISVVDRSVRQYWSPAFLNPP